MKYGIKKVPKKQEARRKSQETRSKRQEARDPGAVRFLCACLPQAGLCAFARKRKKHESRTEKQEPRNKSQETRNKMSGCS